MQSLVFFFFATSGVCATVTEVSRCSLQSEEDAPLSWSKKNQFSAVEDE